MRQKLDGVRKTVCHKTRYLIYRCISNKLECLLNFTVGSSALPSIPTKMAKTPTYTPKQQQQQKQHATLKYCVCMSSDSLPMQTQDDHVPMTDATLTSHGLCRGGSRNIKGQNGMSRLLCLIENFSMASLDNQYT